MPLAIDQLLSDQHVKDLTHPRPRQPTTQAVVDYQQQTQVFAALTSRLLDNGAAESWFQRQQLIPRARSTACFDSLAVL